MAKVTKTVKGTKPVKRTKPARVAKTAKRTKTEEVLMHHVQALMSRNLDEIMKDYCEDSLVCSPMGTAKGLKDIREGFKGALTTLTPEVLAKMKTMKQEIHDDYAYILWSALPAVAFGGDTFHVHNGVIMMQSFVGQM